MPSLSSPPRTPWREALAVSSPPMKPLGLFYWAELRLAGFPSSGSQCFVSTFCHCFCSGEISHRLYLSKSSNLVPLCLFFPSVVIISLLHRSTTQYAHTGLYEAAQQGGKGNCSPGQAAPRGKIPARHNLKAAHLSLLTSASHSHKQQ